MKDSNFCYLCSMLLKHPEVDKTVFWPGAGKWTELSLQAEWLFVVLCLSAFFEASDLIKDKINKSLKIQKSWLILYPLADFRGLIQPQSFVLPITVSTPGFKATEATWPSGSAAHRWLSLFGCDVISLRLCTRRWPCLSHSPRISSTESGAGAGSEFWLFLDTVLRHFLHRVYSKQSSRSWILLSVPCRYSYGVLYHRRFRSWYWWHINTLLLPQSFSFSPYLLEVFTFLSANLL